MLYRIISITVIVFGCFGPRVNAESNTAAAQADNTASAPVEEAAAPLTPRQHKLKAGEEAIELLEAELGEVRRACLLAHQQYRSLQERIETIRVQVPAPRPLELEKLLVGLEAARDDADIAKEATTERLLELLDEVKTHKRVLAEARDDFTYDFGPDQGLITQTRETESSAADDFLRQIESLTQVIDEEEQKIASARRFLFNQSDRQAYIARIRKIEEESNARLDSIYDQWVAVRDATPERHRFGSLPPPPPRYAERRAQRQAAQQGQAAGNSNPQPAFNPNKEARQSEQANNKQLADELRKEAAQSDDPQERENLLKAAEELDPTPPQQNEPVQPPSET